MLGSTPSEYSPDLIDPPHRFYTVNLGGRELWGWQRRDETGAILACSEQLFMDYVSCFCDAQSRNV